MASSVTCLTCKRHKPIHAYQCPHCAPRPRYIMRDWRDRAEARSVRVRERVAVYMLTIGAVLVGLLCLGVMLAVG